MRSKVGRWRPPYSTGKAGTDETINLKLEDNPKMSQVTITTSPELIKLLGEKLYDSPLYWILVRELIQNAVDASGKSDPVYVNIDFPYRSWSEEVFSLMVEDEGCGMDEETLINVFLCIGGSKKVDGSTGGFGIAKVALFNADTWRVETTANTIDQSLELTSSKERKGTAVMAVLNRVLMYGSQRRRLGLLLYGNNVPNLVVDGEKVEPYKPTGRIHRAEVEGVSYTYRTANAINLPNKLDESPVSGYILYRINGLVQAVEYGGEDLANAEKNLVVDFPNIGYRPTDKNYPFSMSREKPAADVGAEIRGYLNTLAKDTISTMVDDGRGDSTEKWWENPNTGLLSHTYGSRKLRPDLTQRRMAKLWGMILETILPTTVFRVGVTDDPTCAAFHTRWHDQDAFVLNVGAALLEMMWAVEREDSLALVMGLWHLACHEAAHTKFPHHDEKFTSFENTLSTTSLKGLMERMNDLRVAARKVWGK